MNWMIFTAENGSGDWVVQARNTTGDRTIYTTIFSGAHAEARAQEYFRWISYRTSATAA